MFLFMNALLFVLTCLQLGQTYRMRKATRQSHVKLDAQPHQASHDAVGNSSSEKASFRACHQAQWNIACYLSITVRETPAVAFKHSCHLAPLVARESTAANEWSGCFASQVSMRMSARGCRQAHTNELHGSRRKARQPGVEQQLWTCKQHGDWTGALALLESIRAQGVTMDANLFGHAIQACEHGGQWERAMLLLEELHREGTGVSVKGFNISAVMPREHDFDIYWQNTRPSQHFSGGWTKYWSHPQVGTLPYLYHQETGEIVWLSDLYDGERPFLDLQSLSSESLAKQFPSASLEGASSCQQISTHEMSGDIVRKNSSVWNMTVHEIKVMLSTPGEVARRGFALEDVARRGLYEYEESRCLPCTLADLQNVTPWFLVHVREGKGRHMFAEDDFFDALADVALERLHLFHPTSIVYLIWSFVRAKVKKPVQLMHAAADYLCDGRLPMLERCGLAMILRMFGESQTSHPRLFKCASAEIQRPVRLHSLAARDIQDMLIGYSKLEVYDKVVLEALARMSVRIMDKHDPKHVKTRPSVVSPFLCRSGSVEANDNFKIARPPSLSMLLHSFLDLQVPLSTLDLLFSAATDYALVSIARAPRKRLEPEDFAVFAHEFSRAAQRGCTAAERGLATLSDPLCSFCRGIPPKEFQRIVGAYKRIGMAWPGEPS